MNVRIIPQDRLRPPAERALFQFYLYRWYRRHHRVLPWRETRDAYSVWVSEIMLQQTRVESALKYFPRFLARFPEVGMLAGSREAEVLALWSGLGYYRRARNLRLAAIQVMRLHGGKFPKSFPETLALPGIGRSTAGAILSIAYDLPHAILDGNVSRVLQRLHARRSASTPKPSQLWSWAEALLPGPKNAAIHAQAMMELGATVCLPSSPRCPECPVQRWCGAFALGIQDKVPAPKARARAVREEECTALIRWKQSVVLEKRRGAGALAGLVGLPLGSSREDLEGRLGNSIHLEEELPGITHHILSRAIRTEVWLGRLARGSRPPGTLFAVSRAGLARQPLDGASRRILRREGWLE